MPKGHHYGRKQTRAYTSEYHHIHTNVCKPLLKVPVGNYSINSEYLSEEHKKIKLSENKNGIRYVTFTINDKPHYIALKLDNRSASNKLYITCPYWQKQRQTFMRSKKRMDVGNVLVYITLAKANDLWKDLADV